MLAFAKSDIGLVRKTNEDSCVFLPPHLFVVADGMGGHEAGEIASNLAVTTISEYMKKNNGSEEKSDILERAIVQANEIIYEMAQSKTECSGMGTTVTAVFVQGEKVFWANVGDSRLYLLCGGRLKQITKDHSLVGELLESGSITPEEAHTHPHRNILTRAVGTAGIIQVDTGALEWMSKDQLLLCTDGLTGMITDEEIAEVLQDNLDTAAKVELLIAKALNAGGSDNITAILIQREE